MIPLTVKIDGRLDDLMASEIRAGERAVTAAMKDAGARLKTIWRGDITSAGLGKRLSNTVRAQVYPETTPSLNAAALVFTKAPQIIGAHEEGALIRSSAGRWLAIPTEAAGKGYRGGRITPGEWQFRTGVRLRFVQRTGRVALLVADDARVSGRGLAAKKRGRRRRDGILTGAATVPIFILVPQVQLRKRLNLLNDAQAIHAAVPAMIVSKWKGLSQS
jgi:hypothetical protein